MKPRLGDSTEDGALKLGVDVISGGTSPVLGGGRFSMLFAPEPPKVLQPVSVLAPPGPPQNTGGGEGGGGAPGDGGDAPGPSGDEGE